MLHLIQVPYDSGHRALRMGRGPLHFVEHGVVGSLRAAGHEVETEVIETDEAFRTEIGTSFALYRGLAPRVRAAVDAGAFPLVLSGNCGSALGTVSGLDHRSSIIGTRDSAGGLIGGGPGPSPDDRVPSPDVGVIWLDAHADFNTPDTTRSGFLDGMALAALTGRCWRSLTESIPGFRTVPEEQVILVGGHDVDPLEREALERSGITWVPSARVRVEGPRAALDAALHALEHRVSRVYLHIDLDIHDSTEAPANHYALPDGLSCPAVRDIVRLVAERFRVDAAALTAYDPACDPEDRMLLAGPELMRVVAGNAGRGYEPRDRDAGSKS